jgi:hypothetical protein
MNSFKLFFEASEEEKNVKDTLNKLPKSHAALIKNYKFKWQKGNCLDGDNNHVGVINPKAKTITIAASYNFGREHIILHELAHKVWETFIINDSKLLKKWNKIVKTTKNRPKQNKEELFCHAYSIYYCNNKVEKFNYPEWMQFIKNLST